MKERNLKEILKGKFELTDNQHIPQQWKTVLSLLFKKIDYFSSPENVFHENNKVVDGRQIGSIKLDDDKQLAIFTVEVSDTISIIRNRQGLREIAARYIDQNINHGSLAFFYNKNQPEYRLSFIAKETSIDLETGELIREETKPKRYTYLLGPNEGCTTAAKRMLVLADKNEKSEVNIDQLKEVFSVEALTKDFFKSYKGHYEKFWKFLADPENSFRFKLIDGQKDDVIKQEKPIRDFVKKLLGRIVFLHFLQKKGWMGCNSKTKEWTDGEPRFMQQLFEDFSNPSFFHSQCLTKLFFETLNNKRTNDVFEVRGLQGRLNGSRVPYLNGGLFEPEKNEAALTVDFPPEFFKEILEFFEQYNFTIDENSPDDHEVGIDPEMLGHIFENLLEDNRDKGAFYTPKEIVQYMCKQSLILYLLNTFNDRQDIETFIRLHTVSPVLAERENAVLLNQQLDAIKICDPAIGSGAFPIGMLQEIFEAKRFIYPYLKTNKDFKPGEIKKNIIQNSIYGVDLEKGAVDIAQLRFWLALVVDEMSPYPLPNLDYKIMQGNSLLEEFGGFKLSSLMDEDDSVIVSLQEQLTLGSDFEQPNKQITVFDKITKQQLWSLIEIFYDPLEAERKTGESLNKTATKKLISEIIEGKIHSFVLSEKLKLENNISEKKKIWNIVSDDHSKLNQKSKEFKKFIVEKAKLEKLDSLERQLIKLQNSEEKPFFLWHTWFKKHVFDKGGFDVMIGNPPYIQLQKMGDETDILQDAGFATFSRTGDIYCLFYEKGFELLKTGGILSYITSNSWLRTKYGTSLRKLFREQTNPIFLINFEDTLLFQSATVEANILIAQKARFEGNLAAVAVKADLKKASLSEYLKRKHITLDKLDDTGWSVAEAIDLNIKLQIEKSGITLKNLDYQINYGIKTGFNDAYIIPTSKKNELVALDPANKKIIKKFLGGRDLSKYLIKWDDTWIINSHNGIKSKNIEPIDIKNDFPTLYNHFLEYKERLAQRADQGNNWWNLRDCAYILDFDKPKLIWAELSDLPKFVYDDVGYYTNKTTFILTGNGLKFLLLLLNSRLLVWYFSQISTSTGMGTTMWSKYKVEEVPIKQVANEQIWKFERLADILIFLHGSGDIEMLPTFDDLANMMVYELYFEEEIKHEEIDVLRFLNETTLPDIVNLKDKKGTVQKLYYELQEKNNTIRNRIIVASSRSETIARINAATS